MAIGINDLLFYYNGAQIQDSAVGNLFPDGRAEEGLSYRVIEVWNNHASLTLTAVRLWVTQDAAGGAFAVSAAPGAPIAVSEGWNTPTTAWDPATGAYSAPTAKAAGIVLPDLPAKTKVRVGVRRDLSGAGSAYPELNRIYVGGTSPI